MIMAKGVLHRGGGGELFNLLDLPTLHSPSALITADSKTFNHILLFPTRSR